MVQHRNDYTPEFRQKAARIVIDSNRRIADVARELDINENVLGRWVGQERRREERHRKAKLEALEAATDSLFPTDEDLSSATENEILRKKNHDLTEQNRLLTQILILKSQ